MFENNPVAVHHWYLLIVHAGVDTLLQFHHLTRIKTVVLQLCSSLQLDHWHRDGVENGNETPVLTIPVTSQHLELGQRTEGQANARSLAQQRRRTRERLEQEKVLDTGLLTPATQSQRHLHVICFYYFRWYP